MFTLVLEVVGILLIAGIAISGVNRISRLDHDIKVTIIVVILIALVCFLLSLFGVFDTAPAPHIHR